MSSERGWVSGIGSSLFKNILTLIYKPIPLVTTGCSLQNRPRLAWASPGNGEDSGLPLVTGQPRSPEAPRSGAELSGTVGLPWLLRSACLCPLTGTVSLCSREEHLWDDKPAFPREDGVDHPSDCGISLDLRVPHPSHCCARLLEVSCQAALAWGLGSTVSTCP